MRGSGSVRIVHDRGRSRSLHIADGDSAKNVSREDEGESRSCPSLTRLVREF